MCLRMSSLGNNEKHLYAPIRPGRHHMGIPLSGVQMKKTRHSKVNFRLLRSLAACFSLQPVTSPTGLADSDSWQETVYVDRHPDVQNEHRSPEITRCR
ncbi:hypothetical protein CEXT_39831 [Caerostris extrusa]|uniref:Uncharacterized protein n=1 Tax=Caerostris extrusa TaxID=172846 RepID=A0AAV4WPK5_CAEEX|nr:hypothetical protein CEXT_39831 [Caerostris extrusa]